MEACHSSNSRHRDLKALGVLMSAHVTVSTKLLRVTKLTSSSSSSGPKSCAENFSPLICHDGSSVTIDN